MGRIPRSLRQYPKPSPLLSTSTHPNPKSLFSTKRISFHISTPTNPTFQSFITAHPTPQLSTPTPSTLLLLLPRKSLPTKPSIIAKTKLGKLSLAPMRLHQDPPFICVKRLELALVSNRP